RKQYMMKAMANVLNEFLHGISQGFADAAFASFKRRRSTVRTDIDQGFGEEEHKETSSSLAYSQYDTPPGGGDDDGGAPPPPGNSPPPPPPPPPSGGGQPPAGGVKGSADVTPKSYEDKLKEMGLKEL
ncbi:MAG: hypothetical protein RIF32_21990, partial [Leptospirales bacterium]